MPDQPAPPEEEMVDIGAHTIWNPGGDPSVLRAAADAWESSASKLRGVAGRLDSAVGGLSQQEWSGDAREAFAAWWSSSSSELETMASGFDEMAGQLRQVADAIEETNEVVRSIYVEIGATVAAGLALSLVSFGLGTAAAAARTATLVARATSWVNRLKTLMTAVRAGSAALTAFKATFVGAKLARYAPAAGRLAGQYGTALAINAAGTMAGRMAFNQTLNPFEGWTGRDSRNLFLGSATGVGVTRIAGMGAPVRRFTSNHRHATAAIGGFGGGATNSLVFDALDGNLNADSAGRALWSGAWGAGGASLAFRLRVGQPSTTTPHRLPPPAGHTTSPSGIYVPTPGPGGQTSSGIHLPGPSGSAGSAGPLGGLRPPSLTVPAGTVPPGIRVVEQRPSGLVVAQPTSPSTGPTHQTESGLTIPANVSPAQPVSPGQAAAVQIGAGETLGEAKKNFEDAGKNANRRPDIAWDLPPLSFQTPPPPPVPVGTP